MDWIVKLIIVGAVIAAVTGGAYAGWHKYVADPYIAEGSARQLKADTKTLEETKVERDAWKQQAADRTAEATTCAAGIDKQNKAQEKLQAQYDAAVAERRKKDAEAARANAGNQARILGLQADAAAKPMLMECKDELAKAKPALLDVLCVKRPTDPACIARAGAKAGPTK
jgi:hypothetical protein